VGLACEVDLNWPVCFVQDASEPIRIAQNQGRALVGRKTPRKPDRKHLRVQDLDCSSWDWERDWLFAKVPLAANTSGGC
jgi:hypothetical protein